MKTASQASQASAPVAPVEAPAADGKWTVFNIQSIRYCMANGIAIMLNECELSLLYVPYKLSRPRLST